MTATCLGSVRELIMSLLVAIHGDGQDRESTSGPERGDRSIVVWHSGHVSPIISFFVFEPAVNHDRTSYVMVSIAPLTSNHHKFNVFEFWLRV